MKKTIFFVSRMMLPFYFVFTSCNKEPLQVLETTKSATVQNSSSGNPDKINVFKGPEVHMGNGKMRSWISVNHAGVPQEIGIEMDNASLFGLPQEQEDFPAATFLLPLHNKAKQLTAFDHIVVNWNVQGHEPEQVFDVPHFDFHFYTISVADQMAIPPYLMAPADFDHLPPNSYWPDMYFPTPGGVPQMGKHWIDGFFAPPFSKIMIYGSFKGKFIFVEPMITRALMLSGNSYTEPYRQPHVFVPNHKFYPTVYNIYKNASSNKHYVTLSNFVWR